MTQLPISDATQGATRNTETLTNELNQLASQFTEEVGFIFDLAGEMEKRLDSLLGKETQNPQPDSPVQATPTSPLLEMSQAKRQLHAVRSRIEVCCNRL